MVKTTSVEGGSDMKRLQGHVQEAASYSGAVSCDPGDVTALCVARASYHGECPADVMR